MTLGRFYGCYLRNARDLMPNFHPILFKFCAYVNYMLIYKMHREGKFPKTITNLAALFLELFEPPSYNHPSKPLRLLRMVGLMLKHFSWSGSDLSG